MPAWLNQGLTDLREAAKTKFSHVGIATDQTALNATQTAIDPANGGASNFLIKSATKTDVDFQTADFSITVTGATEFTNKTAWTISLCKGSARTDAATRTVRTAGIGIQDGDTATLAVRYKATDAG